VTNTTKETAMPNPTTVETILAERGKRYGKFTDHAEITQRLKDVMRSTPGNDDRGNLKWDMLNEDQKEALEMIAHKIGRILNGDPNYHDNWADIAGYATLVADRLVGLPERCVDGCASKANPEPWCDNLGGHL
jgi:hypothetical protein